MVIVILILFIFIAGIGIGFCFGFAKGVNLQSAISARRSAAVLAWVFLCMGGFVLLLGLGMSVYTWNLARVAKPASGIIAEMLEKSGKDSADRTYAPVFSFHDTIGSTQVVSSMLYSYPPEFRVGETVPVLYREGNPKSARINSLREIWGLPIFLCIIGSFLLAMGLIRTWWQSRTQRVQE